MILKDFLPIRAKKFQLKITLLSGVLVIIMTVTLSYLAGKISEHSLQEEATDAMLKLAEQIAITVDNQVMSRKIILEGIAAESIIRGKFGNAEATFDEKVARLDHEYDRVKGLGFLRLGIIDTNGRYTDNFGKQANVLDNAYVKLLYESGQTVVTSTIRDKFNNNDAIIIYATPIRHYATNKIIGILTGVIDARAFSDSISSITYKDSGYGIAIDNRGKIIAHKDYNKVLSEENILEKSKKTFEPLAAIIIKMIKGEEGVSEYIFEGEDKLISYAPVKSTGYSIGINASKNEVLAKAQQGKWTLYALSGLIILLTIIFVYFISERIGKEREKLKMDKKYHEKRLIRIVENSPLGIVSTDKNGKIQYVNSKFTEMTGYTKKEAIGTNLCILKSGIQNEQFYKNLWQIIQEGNVWHGEIANRKKDGTIYWEEMYIVPLMDDNGNVANFVASKKNITEQKRLHSELVQTNCELNEMTDKLQEREDNLQRINGHLTELVREESAKIIEKEKLLMQQSKMAAMGEMVGMIAHQWRQPLNAISAASIKLNMLDELETLTSKELNTTLKFIQEMSQKMSATINDFMDFAKPDREKEFIDIKDVLDSVIKIIEVQLVSHDIALKIEIHDDVKLYLYKKEFAHIFLNLIGNARDAFDHKEMSNKTITIRTQQEESRTLIEVIDNAGGIDASIIDKIFDPFFTTKPVGKGTGLGLYMSKRMVTEHFNGEITVKNVGQTAIFTISIPS